MYINTDLFYQKYNYNVANTVTAPGLGSGVPTFDSKHKQLIQ